MTWYMAEESALAGLIDRDDLGPMIEKLAGYAPAVAEIATVLRTVCDEVTGERLDAFAEQSMELPRTHAAIVFALLRDTIHTLVGVWFSLHVEQWLGEPEANKDAALAWGGMALALSAVADGLRPRDSR